MRAQLTESKGLRSTRTTARHREVPEAGTSNVSVPESLRKTHLTVAGQAQRPPPCRQYTRCGPEIPFAQRVSLRDARHVLRILIVGFATFSLLNALAI
jgi:hypothetical protein